MNKKIVLLGIAIIAFLIVGLSLINNKDDSNGQGDNTYKLKEYDSDIVCTLEVEATEDEEAYTSSVYIYEDGEYITKAIYQTITYTEFTGSYVDMMKEFYDMYKGIDGIETSVVESSNFVVSAVTYDYHKMDSKAVKEALSSILDETSILLKDKYSFKIDWYTKDNLSEYSCEVK